jgi:hypothetical protein
MSEKSKNTSRYYPKWIKKYGQTIADIKYNNYCESKRIPMTGINNVMYGRSVYSVWLEKYGKEEADKRQYESNRKNSLTNTGVSNPKGAHRGKNNGMYGKSFYQVWLEKYGKEIADQKLKDFKLGCRERNSGKNNNMYGKSPGINAGKGYSGRYKGFFFRSLLELAYVVKILEKYKLTWQPAEGIINISYVDQKGIERTYRPDFVINNKYLVEIKPKPLRALPINLLKFQAAELYSKQNNLIFKVTQVSGLSKLQLIQLYRLNDITFSKGSEQRFKRSVLRES